MKTFLTYLLINLVMLAVTVVVALVTGNLFISCVFPILGMGICKAKSTTKNDS